MRQFVIFVFNFFKFFFLPNIRFIRLSPNKSGKIFFYDKKISEFLRVEIRESIDSITADQVFTYNYYDLTFLRRYNDLLTAYDKIVSEKKIPLILDCGANIGLSSLFFARDFPKAKVLAIEPEKNNFVMMKSNCKKFKNVKPLNAAIGSEVGYATIDDNFADNNAFITTRNSKNKGDIKILSINKVLLDNKDLLPFIVKIDIEGFEKDLFSANTEWVERFKLLIIETHDWMFPTQANSNNFLKVISKHNRDFVHKGENIFSISNT